MKLTHSLICALALLTVTACQQRRDNEVPRSWVASPTEAVDSASADDAAEEEEITPPPALGETVDHLFVAQSESLSRAEAGRANAANASSAPVVAPVSTPAKVPGWHMTAYMADIGISLGGFLGALIYKGTPSVTAVFRKQYDKTRPEPEAAPVQGIAITPEMSRQDLVQALEPSIQATLATGRIRDERVFRAEAMTAGQEFQSLTRALDHMDPRLPWKVARFRLDLTVDVTGRITPVVSVGGEVRLRFEWFRMKRPGAPALARAPASAPSAPAADSDLSEGLVKFATGIAQDLVELSDDSLVADSGFKAYSYRVGLGLSKKRRFGVVTSTQSLIGHLYFTRNVPKPVVNPKPPRDDEGGSEDLALIGAGGEEVTPLTHKRFRKGLRRAMKLGGFFARYASRHPDARWKVYELKTGFDLSLAGKTGLAGINGIGATEISFYNQKF